MVISAAGQITLSYTPFAPEIRDGLVLLEWLIQVDTRAAQWAAMLIWEVNLGCILFVTLPSAVFAAVNRGVFWIKH